eukprot:3824347-Pyramimonas_sp.AAC.1
MASLLWPLRSSKPRFARCCHIVFPSTCFVGRLAGLLFPLVFTTLRRLSATACCSHSACVCRWRILPMPRLDAMPMPAEASARSSA